MVDTLLADDFIIVLCTEYVKRDSSYKSIHPLVYLLSDSYLS